MSEQASILIVDDESGPAESLRGILKSRHDVVVASSIATAMEILRSLPIDVIILDQQRPAIGDAELLPSLKTVDPGVEIVLVTDRATPDEALADAVSGDSEGGPKPSDHPYGFAGVDHAAAQRRRAQRAAPTDQLAAFACDLRNPLHAIFGYTEILADESANRLDHWQREALQRLQANAILLVDLLDSACRAKSVGRDAAVAAA